MSGGGKKFPIISHSEDDGTEFDSDVGDEYERELRNEAAEVSRSAISGPNLSEMQDRTLKSMANRRDLAMRSAEGASPSVKFPPPIPKDLYRMLLNEEIALIAAQESSCTGQTQTHDPGTTQIGMTIWTERQKDKLFADIARKGRDDLPYLARRAGKSEAEVRQYLLLLDEGIRQTNLLPDTLPKYSYAQIPCAVEVSEEMCDSMDAAADAVSELQWKREKSQEETRYGSTWLLDSVVAERLLAELGNKTQDTSNPADGEIDPGPTVTSDNGITGTIISSVPEIELLKLEKMLELSEDLFCNIQNTDMFNPENDSSSTALFRSAFSDFHALVVKLTQRLVYTAGYQALSRLRATYRTVHGAGSTANPFVTKSDVLAAIELLGLKQNSHKYWATLPRRLGLTCFWQERHAAVRKRRWVDVDDAEAFLLSRPSKKAARSAPRSVADMSQHIDDTEDASTDLDSDTAMHSFAKGDHVYSDVESTTNTTNTSLDGTASALSSDSEATRDTSLSDQEEQSQPDATLEAYDKASSQREEKALRALLGMPLSSAASEDTAPVPPKTQIRSISRDPFTGDRWRTTTQFSPHWHAEDNSNRQECAATLHTQLSKQTSASVSRAGSSTGDASS